MEGKGIVFQARRVTGQVLCVLGVVVLVVALCIVYARFIEPHWLCIRRIDLSTHPTVRVIHITDIHYDGDNAYLKRVVAAVNGVDADVVCFTGDLIEESAFEKEALQILKGINKPLYGIVGNHDQWALKSFDRFRESFRLTGGDLLTNQVVLMPSVHVALMSLAGVSVPVPPEYRRVLLEHAPGVVGRLQGMKFDLVLVGHTHGGQARIPFAGKSFLPVDLGAYDVGLFQTQCGPLYVNPGIGTYHWKVRFLCRPEVTVIGM